MIAAHGGHGGAPMRVCLFEDGAADLEPLTLTRAVFELRCGITCLGDKQLGRCAPESVGVLVRPHLAPLYRRQHPNHFVNALDWLRSDQLLLINGRWLPGEAAPLPRDPCVGLIGDEVAFAAVRVEHVRSLTWENLHEHLQTWK